MILTNPPDWSEKNSSAGRPMMSFELGGRLDLEFVCGGWKSWHEIRTCWIIRSVNCQIIVKWMCEVYVIILWVVSWGVRACCFFTSLSDRPPRGRQEWSLCFSCSFMSRGQFGYLCPLPTMPPSPSYLLLFLYPPSLWLLHVEYSHLPTP